VQRFFWRNFFRLLVFTAALALWVCLAWVVVVVADVRLPWWMHLAGPVALHFVNRAVLRPGTPPRALTSRLRRAYVGVVFTSLFGMVFLLLNGTFWGVAGVWLHVASLAGLPVDAGHAYAAAEVLGSLGLLAVTGALAHGYGSGQRRVEIVRLEIALPGLAPAFDGYRIVQVSDIHLGNYMDADALAPHVETVHSLVPDLVVLTGDITDGVHHAPVTFPVLGRLRARDGVLAILGNHDFYTGADEVTALLRRYTSFTVLRNDSVAIERDGARLHVLGIDDAGLDWARGVREHDALPPLASRLPAGAAAILLSHRPDLFEQACALGMGLVLAGHTHGGQLALPWPRARQASLAHFMTAYPRGTYRRGNSILHVNLGLGVTGQPVRVFSPREITLITLHAPRDRGEHE